MDGLQGHRDDFQLIEKVSFRYLMELTHFKHPLQDRGKQVVWEA